MLIKTVRWYSSVWTGHSLNWVVGERANIKASHAAGLYAEVSMEFRVYCFISKGTSSGGDVAWRGDTPQCLSLLLVKAGLVLLKCLHFLFFFVIRPKPSVTDELWNVADTVSSPNLQHRNFWPSAFDDVWCTNIRSKPPESGTTWPCFTPLNSFFPMDASHLTLGCFGLS